jgi:type III pantothenate kinase
MWLVADVGNSQTSFGLFDGGTLSVHWRAETRLAWTEDELASLLMPLFAAAGKRLDAVVRFAVASVVPGVDPAFRAFAAKYLRVPPFFVDGASDFGGTLDIVTPSELGADRVANAAYAIRHLPLPAIVVDVGTATTLDVVDGERRYRGGAILPGLRMSALVLGQRTARLPVIAPRLPERAIGRDTVTSLESGLVLGYADALKGLVERMERELGARATVVLTGGSGAVFVEAFGRPVRYVAELTLEGIRLLVERHSPGAP